MTNTEIPQFAHPNSFDGRTFDTSATHHTGVETVLHEGETITAMEPFTDVKIGDMPVMGEIDLGEKYGKIAVVKVDLDKITNPADAWLRDFGAHRQMTTERSLIAIWQRGGTKLYSDLMAGISTGAEEEWAQEALLNGGRNGTRFYQWGVTDAERSTGGEVVPAEVMPDRFLTVKRTIDGGVTFRGTGSGAKVKVSGDQEHEEVIGTQIVTQMEAERNQRDVKIAGKLGALARRFEARSYRSGKR